MQSRKDAGNLTTDGKGWGRILHEEREQTERQKDGGKRVWTGKSPGNLTTDGQGWGRILHEETQQTEKQKGMNGKITAEARRTRRKNARAGPLAKTSEFSGDGPARTRVRKFDFSLDRPSG